ncbi:MAG: Sugar fermentation stimulation protein A [bacterium ADurb.BinA186]|nr:MAG: Sugar fermentation stimulation protein A [bacterium ADurb.BinA186]
MITFAEPLIGKLVARRKRFFMDVELSHATVVAHIANTGSMLGLLEQGNDIMLTKHNDPKRSLAYSVQAVKVDSTWVGVNTMLPNRLVKESFNHPVLEFLAHYGRIQSEVPYGLEKRSRIDFLLSESRKNEADCYLEIKNVTLKIDNKAQFPDALSVRAQKHIDDLMLMKGQGFKAALIFLVQRTDCERFQPAHHIDKIYGQKLREAVKNGLMVKALVAEVSEHGVRLSHEIDCDF